MCCRCFFFSSRRRHTRFDCDWSSDVCSSDLKKDLPVVMTRYPDGITGKSFFQKDAPAFAPDWLRTERMWSEDTQREIDYFVCDDLESLLYLANLGTIPLHVWGSRTTSLEQPDWCIDRKSVV